MLCKKEKLAPESRCGYTYGKPGIWLFERGDLAKS